MAEIFGIRKLESWAIVRRYLRLAVSVEHRLVTDGRTDRQKDTRRQLIPALASVARTIHHLGVKVLFLCFCIFPGNVKALVR